MFLAGYDALGDLRPGIQFVAVEVAQFEAGDEQASQAAVEVALLDVATFDGCRQVLIFRATLYVSTAEHGFGRCCGIVFRHIVPAGQKVANGSAVAGNQALEAPDVAQDMLFVAGIATTGVAVDALVGAHHLGHLSVLHQCLEGRQVGFPQVTLRQVLDVEGVAVPLRTAMYGKVFGTGQQLFVTIAKPLSVVGHALQSAHDGQSHPCCQVGVFAVGLLSASPSRVAEDVDVGRPERQALVALDVARAFGLLGFYTGFVADGGEHAMQQCIVPRGCHRHRDGEHGGKAVAPYTVQRLVPPLELGDAQPTDGW